MKMRAAKYFTTLIYNYFFLYKYTIYFYKKIYIITKLSNIVANINTPSSVKA